MEELKLENVVLFLILNSSKNTNNKWNNLNQIIKIESLREFKNSDKKDEKATRYYISNLEGKTVNYQKNIRSYW